MTTFSVDKLEQLQSHLTDNKTLTQKGEPGPVDASIFFALTKKPNQDDYPHICEWYDQMSFLSFDQLSKLASEFTSTNAAPTQMIYKQEVSQFIAPPQNPKKKVIVPKSLIIFDVKVYEADCNLMALANKIYHITLDGLIWNKQPKIIPIAFGLCKLQIGCIMEDDKVSTDDFIDAIQSWQEEVQSVDIISFQKI